MNNYLLKSLETYFAEILAIKGRLTLIESLLIERKRQILEEKREYKKLVSSITSYRDVSLIGASINLFSPNYSYEITVDTLENEIEDIISKKAGFSISQAYEVFESFLIEILTSYFSVNQLKMAEVGISQGNLILLPDTIRGIIKTRQRTNNKGLISMTRKLSPYYQQFETKNIYKLNFSQWFDMLSMVRHTLVHNRQVISKKLLEYLSKHKAEKMFEMHFERKRIDNAICVFLKKDKAVDVLFRLNDYAHLIYKSLCVEAKLTPTVPQFVQTEGLSRFSWSGRIFF